MHKCPKCGKEYQGNFCPECGEKYIESRVCPQCGAECSVETKFCPQCGYSFFNDSAPQPVPKVVDAKTEAAYKKIHGIINRVPLWLFNIFVVLLFIFFSAPVAVLVGGEIMGEKIPSESFGNLYQAYAGKVTDIPLQGCAVAALLFALFSLAYAIINFFVVDGYDELGLKQVKLFGLYTVNVSALTEVFGWVFYLVFIIIFGTMMGKVSAADQGMGLVSSGACPIALMVISCVFLFLSVACRLADIFVVLKNFPQFAAKPKQMTPREFTGSQPQQPAAVPKPDKSVLLTNNPEVLKFLSKKRLFYLFSALPFIIVLAFFLSFTLLCPYYLYEFEEALYRIGFNEYWLYGFSTLFAVAIGFLCVAPCIVANILYSKKSKPQQFILPKTLNGGKTFCFIISLLCYSFAVSYLELFAFIFDKWLIISSIILYAAFVYYIVCFAKFRKARKACLLLFYGTKKPKNDAPYTELGVERIKIQNEYDKACSEYQTYKEQLRQYNTANHKYYAEKALAEGMTKQGYDYTLPGARLVYRISVHKLLVAAVAVLMVVALTLAVVLPVSGVSSAASCAGASGMNGTYYAYRNGDYDQSNYITINGNKWTDDDGVSGTWTRSGDSLSFLFDFGGETMELYTATYVSEGVLRIVDLGGIYYCKQGYAPPQTSRQAWICVA